jgi:hypothetical protein
MSLNYCGETKKNPEKSFRNASETSGSGSHLFLSKVNEIRLFDLINDLKYARSFICAYPY